MSSNAKSALLAAQATLTAKWLEDMSRQGRALPFQMIPREMWDAALRQDLAKTDG